MTISSNLATSINNLNDVEQHLGRIQQLQERQQQQRQPEDAHPPHQEAPDEDWASEIVSRRCAQAMAVLG